MDSEQKFRLLVENSTDVIFSLDTQGNFTYVSPAIERISGYRVDEVVGSSFVRFVMPEDLPALMVSSNVQFVNYQPYDDPDGHFELALRVDDQFYDTGFDAIPDGREWLGAGRSGYLPGVVAMTAAALVRPPLAPFFVLAVVLASWGVRRDVRRLIGAAGLAVVLLAVVMVPLVLEAGGVRALLGASVEHGTELRPARHRTWSLATLGFTRGLGIPVIAAVLAALALTGWLRFRRALGWRWVAGTTAAAVLVFLLVALHNSTYPRYWVLVWLLGATPALAGLGLLLRRTALLAAVAGAAMAASAWWVAPALLHVHRNHLPVVAALAHVEERSDAGEAVLMFEDQLFSFRNLAVRQGWFTVPALRLSEVPWPRVKLGGQPVWFLSEAAAPDLDSPTSQVVEFEALLPVLRRLSQERFLHARLVRDPLIVWTGGSPPEWAGIRRFVWCGPRSIWLVPPVHGAGRLAIDALVPQELDGVGVQARVAAGEALVGRPAGGRQLLLVPLPDLPLESRLNRVLPLEVQFDRRKTLVMREPRLCETMAIFW